MGIFPSLDSSRMAWKRKSWRPLPYQRHHMFKRVGLWLLLCIAKRHSNSWAANSRALWILELMWKSCIAYNVHGANFISTNWHCWTSMCLSNWGWNHFTQLLSRLLCLVWFHCRWRRDLCTNWTWIFVTHVFGLLPALFTRGCLFYWLSACG